TRWRMRTRTCWRARRGRLRPTMRTASRRSSRACSTSECGERGANQHAYPDVERLLVDVEVALMQVAHGGKLIAVSAEARHRHRHVLAVPREVLAAHAGPRSHDRLRTKLGAHRRT